MSAALPVPFAPVDETAATPLRTGHYAILALATAALYLATARFGLSLAFSTKQVTAIWPPTGVALAAVLLAGYRVWPGIYLGAFLANALASEPVGVAAAIALGNTLTALLGGAVLNRVGFDRRLERTRDVTALGLVAALTPLVSASMGALSLSAARLVPWERFGSTWGVWWIGDALGILISGSLLVTWIGSKSPPWRGPQAIEFFAYLAAVVVLGLAVFAYPIGHALPYYPRPYLAFPVLIWGGLRFGPRETSLGAALIGLFDVYGAVHGNAPPGIVSLEDRLIALDTFIGVIMCTALLLGAISAERRRAESAAGDSDRLLRTMIDHTPAVTYLKDLHGRYLMVNRQFLELVSLSHEQLIGKTDFDLFPPGEAQRYVDMDRRVLETRRSHTAQEPLDDGRAVYVSVKCPALNERGEPYGVFGISTDVTALYQAQIRLKQAKEELEQRVEERTTELRKKNRENEILLREVHHRVKNNMQVISSLLNLQARQKTSAPVAGFLMELKDRVHSMALVHEHLYRSPDLQSVPLREYLRALVDGIAQSLSREGIDYAVFCGDLSLDVDRAMACGLIVNELVTNAFKHAFRGRTRGTLQVCVEREGSQISVVVRDDGIGMDVHQASPSSESFGLQLVTMLTEQLSGTLSHYNEDGTVFLLRFRHTPRP